MSFWPWINFTLKILRLSKPINIFADIPAESTLQAMMKLPKFYATKKKLTAGKLQENTKALLVQLYRPHMEKLAALLKDDRFLWKDGSF